MVTPYVRWSRLCAVCVNLVLHAGLVACKPTEKFPLTGRVSLEYSGKDENDGFEGKYFFNLTNGSSQPIRFRGLPSMLSDPVPSSRIVYSWCSKPDSVAVSGGFSMYVLSSGGPDASPPENIKVSPGERLRLAISGGDLREFRSYRGTRCGIHLTLEDGVIVESGDFEP